MPTTNTEASTSSEARLRQEGVSTSTASATPEMMSSKQDVLWDCERLSLYHHTRGQFLYLVHRWVMFLIIISGTSAFASIIKDYNIVASISMIFSSVLGVLDLVFNFSNASNEHITLYRRFTELRGKMISCTDYTDKHIRLWHDSMHSIYADEPPTYRALEAWCHNILCRSMGHKKEDTLRIPYLHRMFMNMWPFAGEQYIHN